MKHKDLTGQKFNMLTVLSFAYVKETHAYWNCICDCGKTSVVCGSRLMRNITRSCGCLINATPKIHPKDSYKHTVIKDRLYSIFIGIKRRCYNKNRREYKNYGARGITVCDEWLSDLNKFREWALNNGYRNDLSIDRIDVNGNYEPSNCRWVSAKKQANNKTNNKFVTFNGETHTISEWADKIGMKRKILEQRIRNSEAGKYSLEEAFSRKVREHDIMLTYKGKTQNIKSWAEETGLPYSALNQRIYHGWDVEKALTTPLKESGKKGGRT